MRTRLTIRSNASIATVPFSLKGHCYPILYIVSHLISMLINSGSWFLNENLAQDFLLFCCCRNTIFICLL